MAGVIEQVTGAFSQSFDLMKKRTRSLYTNMLWLETLHALIGVVLIAFVTGIALVLLGSYVPAIINFFTSGGKGSFPSLGAGLLPAALLSCVLFVVAILLQDVVSSVGYNVAEDAVQGKKTDIRKKIELNFVPMVLFELVYILAFIVLAFPAIYSFLFIGSPTATAFCFLIVLSLLAVLIFAFFSQFAVMEIVLGKKTALAAIKSSALKVKESILAVLLFDVFLGLAGLAVSGIAQLVSAGINFITDALSAAVPMASLAVLAISSVILLLLGILIQSALSMLVFSSSYYLWKGLRDT